MDLPIFFAKVIFAFYFLVLIEVDLLAVTAYLTLLAFWIGAFCYCEPLFVGEFFFGWDCFFVPPFLLAGVFAISLVVPTFTELYY